MTEQFVTSSGNVFADLGLEDADWLKLKATLSMRVASILEDRDLAEHEAAKILDVSQPHMLEILNGKLDRFSAEELFRIILKLGYDVDILVKKGCQDSGVISVVG